MEIAFVVGLFIVAYLYSSVGHGGASGYLALMSVYGIMPETMKTSALILNIFVSFIAFITFMRSGFFRWKLIIPFIIASVPLSFVGATINISPNYYHKILAICLMLATIRILLPQKNNLNLKSPNLIVSIFAGGAIGFISGLIGIGGGIILSPLLILSKWANIKESACVSAVFILLNSVSGLLGIISTHKINMDTHMYIWVAVAIFGGVFGSFIGANKISPKALRYSLSTVLLLASIKLIFN